MACREDCRADHLGRVVGEDLSNPECAGGQVPGLCLSLSVTAAWSAAELWGAVADIQGSPGHPGCMISFCCGGQQNDNERRYPALASCIQGKMPSSFVERLLG